MIRCHSTRKYDMKLILSPQIVWGCGLKHVCCHLIKGSAFAYSLLDTQNNIDQTLSWL